MVMSRASKLAHFEAENAFLRIISGLIFQKYNKISYHYPGPIPTKQPKPSLPLTEVMT
jgi:hypothetical protein